MYDQITYESILRRMLDRVPSNVDKREGSIIYDALAPAAAELQIMYIELDQILKETFADTASRDYLIKRAAERGVEPKKATKAVLKAVVTPDTVEIAPGEWFRLGSSLYQIQQKLSAGEYQVECKTAGRAGNTYFGALVPVQYIAGLQSAELTELLKPGEDEEGTESIRKRYLQSFDEQRFGGNRKDYIDKADSIAGVGATRVTRAFAGPGTVEVTILDAEYNRASASLIKSVQEAFDPGMDGEGDGLAPIGHLVTVDTAEEVEIQLETKVTFAGGYSYEALKTYIDGALETYMRELRSGWEEYGAITVRISRIEAGLLAIKGIVDVEGTKLNARPENVTLSDLQIPVLGGVTVG